MLTFKFTHPQATRDHLGLIPMFLSELDPRPAKAQINENYSFGGGWRPMQGWKLLVNGNLQYPGDPVTPVLAEARLRDEVIRIYDGAWVTITQDDGTFEVSRMD